MTLDSQVAQCNATNVPLATKACLPTFDGTDTVLRFLASANHRSADPLANRGVDADTGADDSSMSRETQNHFDVLARQLVASSSLLVPNGVHVSPSNLPFSSGKHAAT